MKKVDVEYPSLQIELGKVIAFHPILVHAFGDIESALFFQQIHYWWDIKCRQEIPRGKLPSDIWIYQSDTAMLQQTTLSEKQCRRCRRVLGDLQEEDAAPAAEGKLMHLGVLKIKRETVPGMTGKPHHYQVDIARAQALIDATQARLRGAPVPGEDTSDDKGSLREPLPTGKVPEGQVDRCPEGTLKGAHREPFYYNTEIIPESSTENISGTISKTKAETTPAEDINSFTEDDAEPVALSTAPASEATPPPYPLVLLTPEGRIKRGGYRRTDFAFPHVAIAYRWVATHCHVPLVRDGDPYCQWLNVLEEELYKLRQCAKAEGKSLDWALDTYFGDDDELAERLKQPGNKGGLILFRAEIHRVVKCWEDRPSADDRATLQQSMALPIMPHPAPFAAGSHTAMGGM
jgi:hypothetical protein